MSEDEIRLTSLNVRASEGEPMAVDFELKGLPIKAWAACMIDWFKENGGESYVTCDLTNPETGEGYSITMQKRYGKSPAQKQEELQAIIASDASTIAALRGDLNIALLQRDAKLCSECPRSPELAALREQLAGRERCLVAAMKAGIVMAKESDALREQVAEAREFVQTLADSYSLDGLEYRVAMRKWLSAHPSQSPQGDDEPKGEGK